ncbi:hypothetical protein DFH08DRAFT_410339 [Mycena albidolilacea]|uniref:MYND-type domain-containing protein n=1 Tax=Mycena albidolilacea TaxID=1033008 RepID=A0AAD7AI32_9AGAR|nr:hypothetical protein DFH08DRAFT_410339 [Mycena albidolilacea]
MSSARPHVPTANTCGNCDKHLRVIHYVTPRCHRCLPDETTELKTCECHLVRYCNAECQKNDWEAHRVACRIARESTEYSRSLGVEARHLSFVDWCKHSREQFVFPALWALGAGTDADRTATHLFIIYIDVDEEISTTDKPRFKRRIKTAKCASEAEVRQEFAARYSSEWKVLDAMPLCARIFLVDDGLPYGLELVDQMAEGIGITELRSQVFPDMKCDWLALLEDSVAAGESIPPVEYIYRPNSTRTVDGLRQAHTEKWKASYGHHFAFAASSALDVPQHPNRIVTHCFVVHIDVEEKQPGVFGKTTIRTAKMASLAELRPLFLCDVQGRGSTYMKEILFSQPNVLRTLIIDDSLPYGRNIQVVAADMSKVSDPRTFYPYFSDWFARIKGIVEK